MPDTGMQDMEAMAQNMARLYDRNQEIWQTYLETHPPADPAKSQLDPINVMPALSTFAGAMAKNPERMVEASVQFWSSHMQIWQAATQKFLGGEPDDAFIPNLPEGGKRFKHPQWTENALFEYIKRSYLISAALMQDLVDQDDVGLSPMEQKKLKFITRNIVEAMNPANFFGLNPEVLETTMAENGENLVRGAEMLLEDMRRGKGDVLIRQTDLDAFEVGRDMAVTPGKVIWQNDILQLIQYTPTTPKVHETPLLFIPPWINKFYILDLNEKKSMMRWLVAQGYTVFMVSWVNPDGRHGAKTWDDYLFEGALAAVDKVLEETGAPATHIASYCIGGTLTGTMLAYLSKKKDTRIASTTFFTAQLEFSDAGELQVFVDDKTLAVMDDEMERGYLPAERMATAFNMLRANDLIWSYVVSNYLLGKEPFPFDLLYWNSDSTAMPARVHHGYLENFYIKDAFAQHQMDVAGEHVEISDIEGAVYHVATVEDHIAPPQSVYRGARLMEKAEVTFVLAGSGHIAGVVNPPASGKYQFWVNEDLSPPALQAWKSAAEITQGSWWPHWDSWLATRSGKTVPAREPGAVLGTLEDAPGSFVKTRFDA